MVCEGCLNTGGMVGTDSVCCFREGSGNSLVVMYSSEGKER